MYGQTGGPGCILFCCEIMKRKRYKLMMAAIYSSGFMWSPFSSEAGSPEVALTGPVPLIQALIAGIQEDAIGGNALLSIN
jgi:hypothetical protein